LLCGMRYMGSDHKPLGVCGTGVLINRSVTNGDDGIDTEGVTSKWFKVDNCVVTQHLGLLNTLLLYVSLPYKVMCC